MLPFHARRPALPVGARRPSWDPLTGMLVDPLTPDETAVLAYLPTCLRPTAIAVALMVPTPEVTRAMASIERKLGIAGRRAAVDSALRQGLLPARPVRPIHTGPCRARTVGSFVSERCRFGTRPHGPLGPLGPRGRGPIA